MVEFNKYIGILNYATGKVIRVKTDFSNIEKPNTENTKIRGTHTRITSLRKYIINCSVCHLLLNNIYRKLCVSEWIRHLFIQQLISYNNITIIILNYNQSISYVIWRSNGFSRVRRYTKKNR